MLLAKSAAIGKTLSDAPPSGAHVAERHRRAGGVLGFIRLLRRRAQAAWWKIRGPAPCRLEVYDELILGD